MISNPSIIKKNQDTQQYHSVDINSFLISENVVLIDGEINGQVAEILNMVFLSYGANSPSNLSIIMTNVSCLEFRYVFTLYNAIRQLIDHRKIKVNIQINGTITELAVLLALINTGSDKFMLPSSVIQIKELKIDNSFKQAEIGRMQAVDQFALLDYYEKLEKNYFTLFAKETGIPYDDVFALHERMKNLDKEDLEKLGISFVNQ